MNSIFQYFIASKFDREWGLNILNCGTLRYSLSDPPQHPDSYQFTWKKGRMLHEYQLIYLVEGSGTFENTFVGKQKVMAGTMIMLHPKVWHRYRHKNMNVWNTYWVGFEGSILTSIIDKIGLTKENPTKFIGYNENIVKIYTDIISIGQQELAGYQQLMAGEVMKLLGHVFASKKRTEFNDHSVDIIIQQAKTLLTHRSSDYQMEYIANKLNMGYSKFRKLFKNYTGMSPGEFQMQHKIRRAEELLSFHQHSIKEIAFELGFESAQYFNRIFKKKIGMTPGEYRTTKLNAYNPSQKATQ
ncbi:MAG: AraC family transcriptional regulator [Flavobacteriaceae bacterium]|nr:AraC family transcriptional regulator [Flavobacteriaceae bacterium]